MTKHSTGQQQSRQLGMSRQLQTHDSFNSSHGVGLEETKLYSYQSWLTCPEVYVANMPHGWLLHIK